MAEYHVLIPAAGAGSRMAGDLPKQYMPLLGSPMIAHTLQVFLQYPAITSIHVMISPDDPYWGTLSIPYHDRLHVHRCGGETRASTVLNGLRAIQANSDDWILVHDAARPGLTAKMLDRLLLSLQHEAVGGLLAVPLADTLKRADQQQCVQQTEPRDHLWQAQTPQMFRYGLLTQALERSGGKPTDEAQAIEALGYHPRLVAGGLRNLKVTYPEDLAIIEAIMMNEVKQKGVAA